MQAKCGQVWVAALLLAVFLAGPLASAAGFAGGTGCGMRCCKASRGCCHHQTNPAGGGVTAAWKCPGGCGQLPAVSRLWPSAAAPARGVVLNADAAAFAAAVIAAPDLASSGFQFSLFGRPPPADGRLVY
jgi:hypothetical protein